MTYLLVAFQIIYAIGSQSMANQRTRIVKDVSTIKSTLFQISNTMNYCKVQNEIVLGIQIHADRVLSCQTAVSSFSNYDLEFQSHSHF